MGCAHSYLLGVKQRCCETTIIILRFPIIIIIIIIIIGGQAAKLRDNRSTFSYYYWGSSSEAARQPLFFYVFLLLLLLFHHGSLWKLAFGTLFQDSPISPHNKLEVASSWALVPPIGSSWTCIHVYNFWPIHPIFTNKVSLESFVLGLCQKPSKYLYHNFCAKLGTDDVQTMRHKSYQKDFSNSKSYGRDNQLNETAKPSNRK